MDYGIDAQVALHFYDNCRSTGNSSGKRVCADRSRLHYRITTSKVMRMKRIGILTSGGDAPGMNAAIRAATRAALAEGWEVFGILNGFGGLIDNDLRPMLARDVGGIIQHGGTVLGTARSPEFMQAPGRERGLARLRQRGIDALVVIGRQRLADRF